MLEGVKNTIPPGEKGSPGHPLTVEELEQTISEANGGAEVKVKGYRELSPVDAAIMKIKTIEEAKVIAPNGSISNGLRSNLKDHLHQSLKDVNREPKKLFQDLERGLFLAIDQDDKLWILEKETWFEIKEPGYPDFPKKEIE